MLLINFLQRHKELFEDLEIFDEGEFLETNDIQVLEGHIEACNKQYGRVLITAR